MRPARTHYCGGFVIEPNPYRHSGWIIRDPGGVPLSLFRTLAAAKKAATQRATPTLKTEAR